MLRKFGLQNIVQSLLRYLLCLSILRLLTLFLFSSIRRHTRGALVTVGQTCALPISRDGKTHYVPSPHGRATLEADKRAIVALMRHLREIDPQHTVIKLGRASCRERVSQYV